MSPHTLLDAALWFIASLWAIEQIVRATRVKAPKHNRVLPAPSPLCERTGSFEVGMHGCALTKRQAE